MPKLTHYINLLKQFVKKVSTAVRSDITEELKRDQEKRKNNVTKVSTQREEHLRTTDTKKKFILLDFDGVVADSFLPSYKVYKTIHPHASEQDYRKLFEGNVNHYDQTQDIHTPSCRPDADWAKEYTPVMEQEVRPFHGMKHVLHMLSKKYTIIIISSTITAPIKEFLVKYSLNHYIHDVLGNDVHTSKVVKINMVFKDYSVTGKDCLFITDTLGDMREANKSGVSAIGVTWGYNKVEMLNRGTYYRLVNKPQEILIAVSDYFKKSL